MKKPKVTPVYHLICKHNSPLFCLSSAYLEVTTPDRDIVLEAIQHAKFLRGLKNLRSKSYEPQQV